MPEILFHGDLPELVDSRASRPPRSSFPRAAKDLVETLGIPHTEVGRIEISGVERNLLDTVEYDDRVDVFPHVLPRPSPWNLGKVCFSTSPVAFVADVNVAGAGRLIRLMGFDTLMDPSLEDVDIALKAEKECRVALTRDRNLLKRRIVRWGCLLRKNRPWEQLEEVLTQYGIWNLASPFTRCTRCNTVLVRVEKEKVMDRLEPMTRLYYDSFKACPSCGRVFWRGSHTGRILCRIRSMFGESGTHGGPAGYQACE